MQAQAVASSLSAPGKLSIPAEFAQPEQEQPGIATFRPEQVTEQVVPTIDLRELPAADDREGVKEVAAAGREWGMFQVVNHGIPEEAIRRLQAVGREFFELPQEEKEAYANPQGSSQGIEGYGCKVPGKKLVDGNESRVHHLFHYIWPPHAINYRFWPQKPPTYREANEAYAKLLLAVAEKLLTRLSVGLGLEGHELKQAVGGDDMAYLMKINYYPPCPQPDLAFGVVAHTDMSTLTILLPNEVQGLQAFKDGHWVDVKYVPNALVVHIGDQLEVASNGRYKSVLHRTTVDKEKTRMSWPVFLEPPSDFIVGPIPKVVDEEIPSRYKTKKYSDYVHCKLNKLPQ